MTYIISLTDRLFGRKRSVDTISGNGLVEPWLQLQVSDERRHPGTKLNSISLLGLQELAQRVIEDTSCGLRPVRSPPKSCFDRFLSFDQTHYSRLTSLLGQLSQITGSLHPLLKGVLDAEKIVRHTHSVTRVSFHTSPPDPPLGCISTVQGREYTQAPRV